MKSLVYELEGDFLLKLSLASMNLYTGYFYIHIIITLGTYAYCYHRSPVAENKINKDEYISTQDK